MFAVNLEDGVVRVLDGWSGRVLRTVHLGTALVNRAAASTARYQDGSVTLSNLLGATIGIATPPWPAVGSSTILMATHAAACVPYQGGGE